MKSIEQAMASTSFFSPKVTGSGNQQFGGKLQDSGVRVLHENFTMAFSKIVHTKRKAKKNYDWKKPKVIKSNILPFALKLNPSNILFLLIARVKHS